MKVEEHNVPSEFRSDAPLLRKSLCELLKIVIIFKKLGWLLSLGLGLEVSGLRNYSLEVPRPEYFETLTTLQWRTCNLPEFYRVWKVVL